MLVNWNGRQWCGVRIAGPRPGGRRGAGRQADCSAAGSGNPCPAAKGTDDFNVRTLTYVIHALSADTYTLTFQATAKNGNYTGSPTTDITFTVSNSGAG